MTLYNFCLDNGRNLYVCKEVHCRDIYFAKSEHCNHLTNTDAEAVTVRSVDLFVTSQEETDARIILHCMHIYSNKKETSDFHGTVSFDPVKMSQ